MADYPTLAALTSIADALERLSKPRVVITAEQASRIRLMLEGSTE